MRRTKLLISKGIIYTMTGAMMLSGGVFVSSVNAPVSVYAAEKENETGKEEKQEDIYVLMNIPYEEFYRAELKGNDVSVDAVTSATKTKPRTGSLVGGSYHENSEGTDISGVTYPVKLGEGVTLEDLKKYQEITDDAVVSITVTNRGQTSKTEYKGKEALFEADNYAYYQLKEVPSYYKTLTKTENGFVFGKTEGKTATTLSSAKATISDKSSYGDYQVTVQGLPDEVNTVYGAILETTDGTSYALRHLENIWLKTNLAWSVGYTTQSHGSPLRSEHYKSMMGKTIKRITYITDQGIYKIPVKLYVPAKFDETKVSVQVDDVDISTGNASVQISGLPEDYEPVYSVENVADAKVEDGTLSVPKTTTPGKYTLVISDANKTYANVTKDFTVYTSQVPAVYDSVAKAFVQESGATEEQFNNYIKNITSVSVNGKNYAATGRGSVKLINDDGSLVTDAAAFADGDSFDVIVKSAGYQKDLTFTYTKVSQTAYVLMNIPYDKFYSAEMNKNKVTVDAVTSATKTKPRTGALVGGSYHKDSTGSDISGVTFPVKLGDDITVEDLKNYTEITDNSSVSITVTNRGQTSTTQYKGQEALFESGDYSYYQLKKTPSYYKEVTRAADGSFSFGKVQGKTSTLRNVTASLSTKSSYGDYQLTVKGLPSDIGTVYGVILGTTDGNTYALRHLENMWQKTNLAWSVGYTTSSHGSPLSSEHYKSMMGKTLNKITYITSNGMYKIPVNVYVPVKFSGYNEAKLTVDDIDIATGEGSYTISGLAEDFEPEYSVDNVAGATISAGKVKIPSDTAVGTYTLTATDKNENYAEVSTTFAVYTTEIPVKYSQNKKALEAADEKADISTYIKNISSVTVNGTSYSATGRGAVKLINADGSLVTDAAAFNTGDTSYNVTVKSTGYKNDYSFIYSKMSNDFSDASCDINVSGVEKMVYTGKAVTLPDLTVNVNGQTLELDKDYSVSYSNNTNVGTATVMITGKGVYTGSVSKTFTIAIKGGTKFTVGGLNYKVINGSKVQLVTATGKKTRTTLTISSKITIGGKGFYVTNIAKDAFKGFNKLQKVTIGSRVETINQSAFEQCTVLKTVVIQSENLKGVQSKAFSNIHKKAVITVPKSKIAAYKKLLTKAGLPKTAKVK